MTLIKTNEVVVASDDADRGTVHRTSSSDIWNVDGKNGNELFDRETLMSQAFDSQYSICSAFELLFKRL